MLNRNALLLVAGAAMISASSASAQARPTSSKRIPVSKEAPGEVAAPRVDTVTVYRTDTLRTMGTVDTLRLTNTVTHVDTVTQTVQMAPRHVGGLYLGLGGGVALPYGAIRTVNEPGELGQVNVGWQPLGGILGVRVDGTWNRYARNPDYVNLNVLSEKVGRPMVWTGNAGLRLDLPFFNRTLGSSVRMRPYLIGGGSFIHYSDLRMKVDRDNPNGQATVGFGPQQAVFATSSNSTSITGSDSNWGWYGGGGLGFHSGKKEIFIESRAISFRHGGNDLNGTNTFERSWNIPLVFGVNFF
jgi:hypothetical protein